GHGTLPWVFPMVAFAAYTGARRSEMLRALATDVDLTGSGRHRAREEARQGKALDSHGAAHPEAGRSAAGVAHGQAGKPVPVLPVPAGDAEQDETDWRHGGHEGRGSRPFQADGGRLEVAG